MRKLMCYSALSLGAHNAVVLVFIPFNYAYITQMYAEEIAGRNTLTLNTVQLRKDLMTAI